MSKREKISANYFAEEMKQLCALYGVKPNRAHGQNFLVNEEVYDQAVAAAELTPDDTVLEVGPGMGFLTERLAKVAKRVVAVEIDRKICAAVKARMELEEIRNVDIICGDVLKIGIRDSGFGIRNSYKIVANLPYNITSIFLRKYLSETEVRPELMVLMLQKEVAERITAKPGAMSLLAVSVQHYSQPEIVARVPRQDFWPEPEVDSSIIKLKIKNQPARTTEVIQSGGKSKIKNIDEKEFFRLVKIGFSAKRKMLKNNLANGYKVEQAKVGQWLEQAGINDKARAQDLSLEDWGKLLEAINAKI